MDYKGGRLWAARLFLEEKQMNRKLTKRLLIALAVFVVLAALAVCAWMYLWGPARLLTSDAPADVQESERDRMTITAGILADLRTISGEQTLTATNRGEDTRSQIALRLYANSIQEGSASVNSVTVNGMAVTPSMSSDDPSVVYLAWEWAPGETIELAWHFSVTLPIQGGIIGREDEHALGVGVLPVLAAYEDGQWRNDVPDELGETSYGEAFDYEMTFSAPDSVHAVFGGTLAAASRDTDSDMMVYSVWMQGARDISLALSTSGVLRQREIDGVLVSVLADDGIEASRLLANAKKAIEQLSAVGLAYPFASLSVVQAETGREDGVAGSGLIALSPVSNTEQRLRQFTRLAARQMFGILVESDPWNTPWLSRSLASAVELLGYRARKGESAYTTRFYDEIEIATRVTRPFGVTVGASVEAFGGDAEMTQVLRDEGAAMLLGIEQAVGEEAFLEALRLYVQENASGFGTQEKPEAALLAATGSDWSGYLADQLDD